MFYTPGQFKIAKSQRPQASHLICVGPIFGNHDFETKIYIK